MTRPEILSPVGNPEMLEAAVRAGADAVYLGMGDFNARRNAQNFDRTAFSQAVEYCHIRGVRVYLTLNTLVSDNECAAVLEEAGFAYECGVDAVIVQDLGLARLLRERFDSLELHASTQMTVHTPAALRVLKELGFSQVVVGREMSFRELKAFCHEAEILGVRVEVFVHGALCMCMSGQCYLSAVLGGRSGNRGLCAGPCRLPFSADDGEAYDLSLKDLSLVDHLFELAEIGVSSFKIEGRMKRPEYVAAATAVCRKTLDGESCEEWKLALTQVFSRSGFTDGYFTGRRTGEMFGIRAKEDVLLSASVLKNLHELYRAERQSVAISGSFSLFDGKEARLTLSDGISEVTVFGLTPTPSRREGITVSQISEKLMRTGNTPYFLEALDVKLSDGLFFQASELNRMRREALEELTRLRASRAKRKVGDVSFALPERKQTKQTGKVVARFSSLDQLPLDLSRLSAVILPLESNWESVSDAPPLIVEVPRGIASEEKILGRLKAAGEHGVRAAMCTNLSALPLILEAGLRPIFDFSMNLYSTSALKTASALGSVANVVSFEATRGEINRFSTSLPLGVIGYGRLPLMLTRNCPISRKKSCQDCSRKSTLTDRRGIQFPVRCREGYSELFNSVPLWIGDEQDGFRADFFVLYFTVETAKDCTKVIDQWQKKASFDGEFTRGLYHRGVE